MRARDMIAAGTPVIELTIGEHDIRTDPRILDEMHRRAKAGHTGYASVPGTKALRDAVAARVTARTGVPTTRDNVVVTPGGQAGLFAAHTAVLDPGDTGLFIDPYYTTYPGTVRGVGAKPRAIKARPRHGFQPQAADIAAQADGARSLLINSPNNPTGVVYTPETMQSIARTCADHDLWLVSDEVYDTQIWNGTHLSAWQLEETRNRTLVVNSMSKSFAMTGSRIGWILGPEHVIAHLIDLSTHTTYGVPGYIQDAALFALQAGEQLEADIAAPFRRRRAMAVELLAHTNAAKSAPCDGAMYLMLDIRATGLSGEGFANRLLDQERIAVMPGESFGEAAAGHVRVAMTVADEMFAEALGRIIHFAEALTPRGP
ncbi:Aspartate aminotransferase [Candidatus Rhodobacter oscarellae]|uniref:Aminotransferase n=2 Tax=Candidatus Rhodobacter oscarellae TaxID=1675527 RepID=A0A0J9E1U4_9RHOB|nr:Aspartate aminotransferase [Candidatus Rhodobacter lobularis]